jgi:hypothetical protein
MALVQAAEPQRAEIDVPDAVGDLLHPPYSPTQTVDTLTHRLAQRMPPLALTYRTSKRSWYSRGGRRSGIGRGEGV